LKPAVTDHGVVRGNGGAGGQDAPKYEWNEQGHVHPQWQWAGLDG